MLLASQSDASTPTTVRVLVSATDGEVQIYNSGGQSVLLTNYLLESATSSLLPGGWTPIAGRLDDAGDGSFDETGNWLIFPSVSPGLSLSEGVFDSGGGTLDPFEAISLGQIWNPSIALDISATLAINEAEATPSVILTPVGDYDRDGDVDTEDYQVFRDTYGSQTDFRADGNEDGSVDAADYAVWRNAISSNNSGGGAVVSFLTIPEPAPVGLLLAASAWLLAAWRGLRGPA